MTESSHQHVPTASRRPTVVAVSSYLLYAAAAMTLLNAVISLSFIGTTARVAREAVEATTAQGAAQGMEVATVALTAAGAAVSVLLAAGLIILGIFNNRGRNPSRIVTWVIGGLAVCCGGLGVAGDAVTGSMNLGSSGGNGPDTADIERRVSEALPNWYGPVTNTLSVLMVLAILAAVVLLALPAANEYFRPQQAWAPPLPGYPAQPTPPYPSAPYPSAPYPSAPYPSAPYSGQPPPGYPPSGHPPSGPAGQPAQPPQAPPQPPPDGDRPPTA